MIVWSITKKKGVTPQNFDATAAADLNALQQLQTNVCVDYSSFVIYYTLIQIIMSRVASTASNLK